MKRSTIFLGLLGLAACGRKDLPPPQASLSAAPAKPWSCEILNGVLVVRGEVDRPMDLVLEGRSIHQTHHAEFGPVRWEMFKPPAGEVARLRTADGRVLAQWRFGAAPRKPAAAVPPRHPQSSPAGREDPLDELRRQLASAPSPAPVIEAIAAVEPVRVPVMRADLAPSAPSRSLSWSTADPLKPKMLTEVKPQPLPPIHAAPIPPAPLPLSGEAWPGAGEGFNLVRGPKALQGGQRRMVLSFDGGSSDESAEEILDALKARSVRTTLFLTGTFIQKFPDLVRRMAREGHELGNHTMNHPHFAPGMKRDPKWTKEKFQEELLQADRALVKVLGRPMNPYWRAPYGEQTKELRAWAEEIGFRHVGWSEGADTLDWATLNEKRIYRSGDAVLARLHKRLTRQDSDGLIVLMHLGSGRLEEDRPSKNLGAFMDRAAQEGWQFVRVGDYLDDLHKPSWSPASRLALVGPASGGGTSPRAALRK